MTTSQNTDNTEILEAIAQYELRVKAVECEIEKLGNITEIFSFIGKLSVEDRLNLINSTYCSFTKIRDSVNSGRKLMYDLLSDDYNGCLSGTPSSKNTDK